jgi:hypothetical protein
MSVPAERVEVVIDESFVSIMNWNTGIQRVWFMPPLDCFQWDRIRGQMEIDRALADADVLEVKS